MVVNHNKLKQIVDLIYDRKEKMNLSLKELAELSGVGFNSIINIVKCRNVTIKTLFKVLDTLDIELRVTHNLPKRDLYTSPDHALYVEDK